MKFIPWMCRIFGHKWWIRASESSNIIRWEALSHCDRCGEPNPRNLK